MASEQVDGLVGAILADRYKVIKKLGEGGMGSVYLAEHTTINKKLAIKVLSPEYSHKQDLVDRFLQEARAASMIEQENVVEITDFGATPGGSVFFVMEFLNGEDLSDTVKSKGSLEWGRVKSIMLQICDALSSAHEAGIIHRDMKPENCYRIKRGSNKDFIKVLDFGIAKVTSDEGDGGRSLTRTGMIFGTPEYMSPEQAKGEKVDHRVDVYATGVIMYELLTGRVPFTADTFMGILTKHMFEAPAAPSTIVPGSVIPHEVEAIILKALQKDREYRFQSMDEMAEAIRGVGDGTGAVAVVQEEVATPTTGQIRFADGSVHGAGAVFDDDLDEPAGTSKGPIIGLAIAAVLVLGGVGAYAAGLFDGEPPPPEKTPVVAKSDPKPPPETKDADPKTPVAVEDPPTPAVGDVKIIIKTDGIVAKVYDNADDSELGLTNEEITVPHSSAALDLYIRAEGYEDFNADLVPDKDKTLTVALAELTPAVAAPPTSKKSTRNSKRGRKGKTKGTSAAAAKKGTATTPAVTPKKDPPPANSDASGKGKGKGNGKKGSSISGDLKNPFGKK